MECRIDEVMVNYVEHGSGVPLVALHGAGVDHREIEAGRRDSVAGYLYAGDLLEPYRSRPSL